MWKGCSRRIISLLYSNLFVWCFRRFWFEREFSRFTSVIISMFFVRLQFWVSEVLRGVQVFNISFLGFQRCQDEFQVQLRFFSFQLRWIGQFYFGWCYRQLRLYRCFGSQVGGSQSFGSQVFDFQNGIFDFWSQIFGFYRVYVFSRYYFGRSSSYSSEFKRNGFFGENDCLVLVLVSVSEKAWWGVVKRFRFSGLRLNEDYSLCLRGRGRGGFDFSFRFFVFRMFQLVYREIFYLES